MSAFTFGDGVSQRTLANLQSLQKSVTTTGITNTTNLLYYNLEPLARRLYPVWFPLLNSVPRHLSDKPGSVVHWKTISAVAIGDPGTSEGNRNAYLTITENDYLATYKYLGAEVYTTFPAQYGSQGFDDALGIANTSRVFGLMNQEERVLLLGNSGTGTGNNGFQMATAPTVSAALSTTAAGASSMTISDVTIYVAPLTGWGSNGGGAGNPIVVGSGLGVLTSATRTNADASTDTIYGGVGKLSSRAPASSPGPLAPSTQSITVTVTPVTGAVAYVATFLSMLHQQLLMLISSAFSQLLLS